MKITESELLLAKSKSIVDYLSSLGYPKDKTKSGSTYSFFRSPLRATEKTASFAVHNQKNTWRDYGSNEYGDIVGLCMKIEGLTFNKAIERLIGIPLHRSATMREYENVPNKSTVEVLEVKDIVKPDLIEYLKSRRIDIDIARHYCKEVKVNNNSKVWSAIGFENDSHSWELRNKYVKIALAPKDVSTIGAENKDYYIFEGFIDMLSYATYAKSTIFGNVIVLNSVSMVGRVKWENIITHKYYLGDNDKAGDMCLKAIPNTFDLRSLFKPHKDVNDWLMKNYIY